MKKIIKIVSISFIAFILCFLSSCIGSCVGNKPSDILGGGSNNEDRYYTINYDLDGGIFTSNNVKYSFKSYKDVILPSVSKEGSEFLGWYDLNDNLVTTLTSNKDYNLVAKWKAVSVIINYHDFLSNPNSSLILSSAIPYVLQDPVKVGYKFLGWYDNNNFEGEEITVIDSSYIGSSLDLYAKYELINYTITYELDGGSLETTPVTSYTILSDDINLFDYRPVKEGFYFNGWFSEDSEQVISIPSGSTGNISITASWSQLITYTFCLNNGQNDLIYTAISGAVYDLPVPTYEGYEFLGWYDGNDKPLSLYTSTEFKLGNENKVYYAKWESSSQLIRYEDGEALNIYENTEKNVFYLWIAGGITFSEFYEVASHDVYNFYYYQGQIYVGSGPWGSESDYFIFGINGFSSDIYEDEYCYTFSIDDSTLIESIINSGSMPVANNNNSNVIYLYKMPNSESDSYVEYESSSLITFEANKDYYIAVSHSMTNEDKYYSASGVLTKLGSFVNSISSDVDGLYIAWYAPQGDNNFIGCLSLDYLFNDLNIFAYLTFVSEEDGFDLFKFSFSEEQFSELKEICCDLLSYEREFELYKLMYKVVE